MTIELGPKPNGVRTAAADTRNQKNKPSASEGDVGGFGAVLASLDSSEVEALEQPEAEMAEDTGCTVGTTEETAKGAHAFNTVGKELLLADTVATFRSDLDADSMKLAATQDPMGVGLAEKRLPDDPSYGLVQRCLTATDAASLHAQASVDTAALRPQTSQWENATGSNSQSIVKNEATNTVSLVATGTTLAPTPTPAPTRVEGLGIAPDLPEEVPVESFGKTGKSHRDSAARQLQIDTLTATAHSAAKLDVRSEPARERVAEQIFVPLVVPASTNQIAAPTRRDEQTRLRSIFQSNGSEPAALGQAFASPAPITSVQYTPELQMPPDVFVAEKVAYWISNDVQNAEMKLDGFGLDPVEVSIRMNGNEAHVAFRTDELQARAALESASTHLKELLQQEGLVLTGVSVGTAGTGDSGGSYGKSRQGTRQTNSAIVAPLQARTGPVAGRIAGGRLDLFV
jgi:flagellar hook-length control protein FliK